MYFAVMSNDEDCVELLLDYGARVDLDPIAAVNIPICKGNMEIFEMLLDHGADIHEVCPEVGLYPAAMASALTDYRFITKLCQLGLDTSTLFSCPYGSGDHPEFDELKASRGKRPIPWCYHLARQRNTMMGNWLMPYLAKFTYPTFQLCAQMNQILSEEAKSELARIKNTHPTLKNLARLKVKKLLGRELQYSLVWRKLPRIPPKIKNLIRSEDIKW